MPPNADLRQDASVFASKDLLGISDKYADIIYDAPLPHPDHIHAAVKDACEQAWRAGLDEAVDVIREYLAAARPNDSVGRMTATMLAKKILARRDAEMPNADLSGAK